MRTPTLVLASLAAAAASSQTVTSVYNRDTHEPFRLKNVSVESTVVGPIVRTSTWLTYANPYTKLTEATLNFELPDAAALSGFAYRYGEEYVPGRLMDKAKAWFIYTAITSRNRDPGIMEQWSPTTYHCQIFPIKQGHDLRVRLWTVGMVGPDGALPRPQAPNAVGYEHVDDTIAKPDWTVRSVGSGVVAKTDTGYAVAGGAPVTAVAQRFKDGRTYVAGLVRATDVKPDIRVARAYYGAKDGKSGYVDVTKKVAAIARRVSPNVRAENAWFGDPAPGKEKQLRIGWKIDGQWAENVVPEHARVDLAAGATGAASEPRFRGLRQPRTVRLDDKTFAFSGWLPKNRTVHATCGGRAMAFRPKPIPNGADAARLWAQQMLAKGDWRGSRDVLAFSLKYGVPSNATALLAVPQEEMARYRAKEKEFQKAQAEARRREAEQARKARAWAKSHPQNWRSSGGGDPEIRVTVPNAVRVEAILPDRRVVELTADGDMWGGNFEIPASAPEGVYKVRIVAHLRDGTTSERSWTYDVDRTAPRGTAAYAVGTLTVESEAGLPEVTAYGADGTAYALAEVSPGVYRGVAPKGATVVLKDRSGNKGEVVWRG